MLGSKLGNWVLDKEIGRGGMGRVYLAHEDPGERQAAVKVLAAELALEPGFLQRFEREIEILSRLSHPNIVKFFESGAVGGHFYYAMEYIQGESFEEILQEHGRFPWMEVLDAALQICPALKHAHDHGVIHRDLKPPNLMRTGDGAVKLADFGIAKVFAGRQLTCTGGVVGTAEYLSPEQAAGKPATKRSDLYSLGAVLYMLLTGRTPFTGTTTAELLHKHLYARFDRPHKLVPEIPHELDEIVCQLLEKDPSRRPPDALVLHRQLDSFRRKIDRKAQLTLHALSKERTLSDNHPGETAGEGPATFVSRMVRTELEEQQRDRTLFQWTKRPWVLATMLAGCIGVLVWTFWPERRPDPEWLFEQGSFLMSSPNPDEWETAWNEYLEPLSRYPGNPHHDELEALKLKRADGVELRKAVSKVHESGPVTEAQRFYLQGLRLCREGDADGTRRVWQNLVDAFEGVDNETHWVELARAGLADLNHKASSQPRDDYAIQEALKRARKLEKQGKQHEANQIRQGLRYLYQADPTFAEILKRIDKSGAQ
jgi:serine/threonine-protein kinase